MGTEVGDGPLRVGNGAVCLPYTGLLRGTQRRMMVHDQIVQAQGASEVL